MYRQDIEKRSGYPHEDPQNRVNTTEEETNSKRLDDTQTRLTRRTIMVETRTLE